PLRLQLREDLAQPAWWGSTEFGLELPGELFIRQRLHQQVEHGRGDRRQPEAPLLRQDQTLLVTAEDIDEILSADDHGSPSLSAIHGSSCSASENSSSQMPSRSA